MLAQAEPVRTLAHSPWDLRQGPTPLWDTGLLRRSPGALLRGLGPLADPPGEQQHNRPNQNQWPRSILTAQTHGGRAVPQGVAVTPARPLLRGMWGAGQRPRGPVGNLPSGHALAHTWENWPQSKGALGGGDASDDAVKQEADLLPLG